MFFHEAFPVERLLIEPQAFGLKKLHHENEGDVMSDRKAPNSLSVNLV